MLSASDGWSVGEAGTAYRWNGAAWSKVPTPRTELLNDVHMVAASDGWAVGEAGAILRWNGSAWTDYTAASISQELRGVAMISAADGWAMGGGGVILRWNGSAWRTVVAPAHTRLESLAMTPGMSGGDGWAVGGGRNLLHSDGNSWTPVAGPTSRATRSQCRASRTGTGHGSRRPLPPFQRRGLGRGGPSQVRPRSGHAFHRRRLGGGVGHTPALGRRRVVRGQLTDQPHPLRGGCPGCQ